MDSKDSKVDPNTVEKDLGLGEVRDIGANLYLEAEQLSEHEVEQEGAKILRIIDWRLMPIVSAQRRYPLPLLTSLSSFMSHM